MIGMDLGSNTLRIVQICCQSGEKKGCFEKIVGTARGMQESLCVTQEAVDRICEAIHEAHGVIDFGDEIVAVTTQAIRMAKNQQRVLEEIFERTGVSFRVISGEEEGRLTLCGVKHTLKKIGRNRDEFWLIDMGGGSTEIGYYTSKEERIKSFPVGIVTATETWDKHTPLSSHIHTISLPIEAYLKEFIFEPLLVICTAGTATTLVALKKGMVYETYEGERVNGEILTLEEIAQLKEMLVSMGDDERQKAVGVGREELILVGIDLLLYFLTLLDVQECMVVDDGLREGVAYEGCKLHFLRQF